MKQWIASVVFLFNVCTFIEAQIDTKWIGKNYYHGVVKVILYDNELVDDFHLKNEQGQLARGSGFIVTPEGTIFTNRHVVEWCVYGYAIADWVDDTGKKHKLDLLTYEPGLEKDPHIEKLYYLGHTTPVIQVFKTEEQEGFDLYLAEVIAIGKNFDGAMLRIVADIKGDPVKTNFTALPLGDSNNLVLGEELAVLGYPEQYNVSNLRLDLRDTITLTRGINSGWDYVFDEEYGMLKTDAEIHEGNSGGPVFGDDNRVVGIATALGIETNVGLVGPINCMYWIAKANPELFTKLVDAGLHPQKRGKSVEVVSGKAKPLPKIELTNPMTLKKVEATPEPEGLPSVSHFPILQG